MNRLDASNVKRFLDDGEWECHYSLKRFVRQIRTFVEEEGLELNPDFQRGHVWSEEQQISYMESLLRGGCKNSRVVYLNHPKWNLRKKHDTNYKEFVCVDGLQRITAITNYMDNKIKVFGFYRNQIDNVLKLETENIRINVNSLKSKEDVLCWYLQMNEGGTPHTKEELDRVRILLQKGCD